MTSPSQKYKESCFRVIESVLAYVKPENLLDKKLDLDNGLLRINEKSIDLSTFRKIHIIAAGKAATGMTRWVLSHAGDKISGGIIISDSVQSFRHKGIISLKGDHPVPGANSIHCGNELAGYIKNITGNDLVIGLISGGSSSMILAPPDRIDPEEIIRLNRALLKSGADISEINTVRKHLSAIKGGNLAQKILPASIISLLISDVKGDDPGLIGSGIFSGDRSSFEQALLVLRRHSLLRAAGENIIHYLNDGISGKIRKNPSGFLPENVRSFIIGNNKDALKAAKKAGEDSGFRSKIIGVDEEGDVRSSSTRYARFIKDRLKRTDAAVNGRLFVFGGEFTVSVRGKGLGGRVQEFLLHLLYKIRYVSKPFLVAGIGTDGRDGPTDAAGAWISNETFQQAGNPVESALKALKNNDSYRFFKETGQLIVTGPTGTNVRDIFFIYLP